MIRKSLLESALRAKEYYSTNVVSFKNEPIRDIVGLYPTTFNTPEEVLDYYDVSTRDFTIHDNSVEQESIKLAKNLNACRVTWESKVKPLTVELLDRANKLICEGSEKLLVRSEIKEIYVNESILQDASFNRLMDSENYIIPSLPNTLNDLSLGMSLSEKTLEELNEMIVNSKCIAPDNAITYLADIDPILIQDLYREVFINRNRNGYLPIDYHVTEKDYLTSIKYSINNMDKLYLTIMLANYLIEHVPEELNVTLEAYSAYIISLRDCAIALGALWTREVLSQKQNGTIVPAILNGGKDGNVVILVNGNTLENVTEFDNPLEIIIAIAESKGPGNTVTLETLKDAETIEKATSLIDSRLSKVDAQRAQLVSDAIEKIIVQDATINNLPLTQEDIIGITRNSRLPYTRILDWVKRSRYMGTYVEVLIDNYINLSNLKGENIDVQELNGGAIARLAAYIVTH
jgi:hypothetical protein